MLSPQSSGAVPLRPSSVRSVPVPPLVSDNHSNHSLTGMPIPGAQVSVPAGSSPSEVSVLRGLVRQLVDVCQSNQQHISLLREKASRLRDESRAESGATVHPPQVARGRHARPFGPGPVTLDELWVERASQPLPPQTASGRQRVRVPSGPGVVSPVDETVRCRRARCSQQVSARCPVQFCRAHCTSSRCQVHSSGSPSRSRQRRRNGCTTVVPRSCISGFCEAHIAPRPRLLHQRLW